MSRVFFVQALQTSRKTTTIWLITCIVVAQKTWAIGSEPTNQARNYFRGRNSAGHLHHVRYLFLFVYEECPCRILLPK